ncbi:unnamed protein product [Enterobius vermicularis]|uniref:SH2 domain-containing protein n=1 Tax=Enterobius vermicularis TaxID=51028 RepID=A0A0N4UXY7_ENTVE|nr:unnamed protein product [Enterobius vermicularis]
MGIEVNQNCDDGAFIVRDASTQGDYTLTVRYQKKNRLIKIRVVNGCYGFSEDGMSFDSVLSLINYFKRNSLVEYNRLLDIKLKLPVSRVRCKLSPWEVDGANDRSYLIIQMRGLCLELWRTRRFDDNYTKDLENLYEELLHKQQTYAAFETVFKLFYDQWQLLSEKLSLCSNEEEEQFIQANLESQKTRNFIKCRFRLLRLGVHFDQIDDLIAESNGLCITESEELSKVLLQLSVRWQPDRYISWDSSKANATKLIREVMDCNPENPDGIFVIRPSQSQEGHFALTVSKDNRILHCLIEQSFVFVIALIKDFNFVRDTKHPEACGFGFHNTDIFFPTIVDLVRYYTHYSLKKHNQQLDTRLRIPVFRGTI